LSGLSPAVGARLSALLDEHGINKDTILFRTTLPEFLQETDDPQVCVISANPDPSEAVVDEFGCGHTTLAVHVGQGLAFASLRENQWVEDGRVAVALRLGDALDQGGLIYPVESVITETVWYVTLPDGRVRVARV
jgi:hypothetical protein